MTNPFIYCLSALISGILSHGISSGIVDLTTEYSAAFPQIHSDKRLLLNGRIWRNQFSKVSGDQFFLTNKFLKGSLTLNGRKFNNLDLQYDIASDELLLSIDSQPVIIMNKEMVDSFDLLYENKTYHIINAGAEKSKILKGYVNLLYDGPSTLYVKYLKKIVPLSVDGRQDEFFLEHRVFLRKGSLIVPVVNRRTFLGMMEDKKEEIRHYMKSNHLKIIQNDPYSLIPLLKFYDNLSK